METTAPGRWSAAERDEIWARWQKGESSWSIGRRFGTHLPAVRRLVARTGGCRRPPPRRAEGVLMAAEREEVSRGLASGELYRAIARRVGRADTTVSREVARNGGPAHYRAAAADTAAWRRAERPTPALLATRPALREAVEAKLRLRWSPEQIAHWLPGAYPDDPEMRVSHETIYLSLFVQPRGARSGGGRGQLRTTVSIRERPAVVEDRAVLGHWEGDLVFGRGASAVGTRAARSTRYRALVPVPAGYKAPAMREALAAAVARVPDQLRRALTWDRGKEMADHVRFTVDTGLRVFFRDPRSPWQRGTNENTNGLLRQYLPESADLEPVGQAELDAVAAELNGRPRPTLGWRTPAARCLELAEAG